MFGHQVLRTIYIASTAAISCHAKLTWGNTKYVVAFGDSYTTDGYNISAGIDSVVPGWTSSNGPNWVQHLRSTYNVANTKIFNLASGGATIDAALVPPWKPTVLSVVDQVNQFKQYLAPKPKGAEWSSNNTLFAFWIGINDIGNSISWTNVTSQPQFYSVLMKRLDSQLEELYSHGARSFLFLTVPPTDRAPLYIQQGHEAVSKVRPLIASYNEQLFRTAQHFEAKHRDIQTVTVFDTQPVFNTLLDNAKTFGFVNVTGWCEAYQNGTPGPADEISPCTPVSSYFWLNSLHPLFTVHNSLAHALTTKIS